ncbi:hypothetical protein L2E82_25167 [Cichorium intybus]|uniref:Uncharacterized protein n=1 Tax=Cichorium intybus TaxID=13427 RepID=A0ACB9E2U4_CICIN|nr:hypothetical protein L2E82_25167 [Cichorium intybus]
MVPFCHCIDFISIFNVVLLDGTVLPMKSVISLTKPRLLEKIMDRLSVVWGAVVADLTELEKTVDTPELRSAIEEIQPEKVEFDLKLGQSKPIYNAFKAIRESPDWPGLSDAQKRIVERSLLQPQQNRFDWLATIPLKHSASNSNKA